MNRWFGIALVLSLAGGCESKPKKDTAANGVSGSWAGSMQGLAREIKNLLPFVYDRSAYLDQKNAETIKQGLKEFGQMSHAITTKMGETYFGEDPILAYSLESLKDDVQRAQDAFSLGQKEYSRGVVKTVMNHCFRCHSMIKEGTQSAWDLSAVTKSPLQPLEKVDLLVASRKYPEAVSTLESLLIDENFVQTSPFEYEGAIRKYLALMLRAENNPARAKAELDKVLAVKGVPFYVREQAGVWQESLASWSKTHSKKIKSSVKEAQRVVRRGMELQQYAKDHAGDIEFLRATSILHDYLRSNGRKSKADAYWLLGQSYEVLDELGYWNLHELYYESCIRAEPKSSVARQCYARLEASVYMGFSGSSGVHVPESERTRLKRLKELMEGEAKSQKL